MGRSQSQLAVEYFLLDPPVCELHNDGLMTVGGPRRHPMCTVNVMLSNLTAS